MISSSVIRVTRHKRSGSIQCENTKLEILLVKADVSLGEVVLKNTNEVDGWLG